MPSIAAILKELPSKWAGLLRAATLINRIRPGPGAIVDYSPNGITIGFAGTSAGFDPANQVRLIAKVTGTTGCGYGYYTADFYRISGEVLDESTALTNAKLAVSAHKVWEGFVFNMQEIDASTNDLTDAGNTVQKYFNVEIVGASQNSTKPIGRLLGNAIWTTTCPT